MRILLGAIIPLIAVYLSWSIGTPPPKSIFWKTVSGEVSGYSQETVNTGYGMVDMTWPEVLTEAGETVQLNVENTHDGDIVRAAWPVGARLDVRLKPSGKAAYAASDPRLHIWTASVLTGGALVILAFFIASFFFESGSTQLFIGGVGACFIMLPLILLRFMWMFGDPPAVSLFWPSETVEVATSEVRQNKWAGGRTVERAYVTVRFEDGTEERLETVGKAQPTVEQFAEGSRHEVMVSPGGQPYEKGLRARYFIAFFMTVIGPIAIGAGCWLIFRALRPAKASG